MCACVLKHLWKKLKSQFSEQDHQCPSWSEKYSLSLNAAAVEGGKDCLTCAHHEWITHLNSFSIFPPSPTKASSLPKFQQPGTTWQAAIPEEGKGGKGEQTSQAHILEQVLFVFWIKLAFGVRTSRKFCSTSEQEGFCWAPNKGWTYQTLHKSVFCTLQAAAPLVWRKEKVYLQSCSQKGYYYYKNKHHLLWYILSKDPLISPDFFHSKASRQSLFQQEAKNTAI